MLTINSENLTIVTFATFGKYRSHRDYTDFVVRLRQSCSILGLNLLVFSYATDSVEADFVLQDRTYPMRKGAGYWSWKPEVIREASQFAKTRYLMYLDSDLILNRLPNFSKVSNFDELGVAVFQTDDDLVYWTSKRCLKYFGIRNNQNDKIFYAGSILLDLHNRRSFDFLDTWEKHLLKDRLLLDPFWSFSLNHRHDQSILSCLVAVSEVQVALLPSGFFQTGSVNKSSQSEAWLIHGETNILNESKIVSFLSSLKSRLFHKFELGFFLFHTFFSNFKIKIMDLFQ